jgi:hypothetical protein
MESVMFQVHNLSKEDQQGAIHFLDAKSYYSSMYSTIMKDTETFKLSPKECVLV